MTIQICPIKRLYQILAKEHPGKSGAIISSALEIDAEKIRNIPYMFRQYDDLDYECPGRSFSQHHAAAFAEFITSMEADVDTLYCCCDAGESRSPAVAAAAMRYFGMDDMPVWRNPRYHPNMFVFAMLTEALGQSVPHEELDLKLNINQKAFRDAVRR